MIEKLLKNYGRFREHTYHDCIGENYFPELEKKFRTGWRHQLEALRLYSFRKTEIIRKNVKSIIFYLFEISFVKVIGGKQRATYIYLLSK